MAAKLKMLVRPKQVRFLESVLKVIAISVFTLFFMTNIHGEIEVQRFKKSKLVTRLFIY